MEHKQKMIALGAGAIAVLLLLVLSIVLLASSCGADTPPKTEPQTTAGSTGQDTDLPANTQPNNTQPTTTQPPEPTVPKGENETDGPSIGIDVARYQGTIDWEKVAAAGIEFAMIRVGYRTSDEGVIVADSNARYNMQEASKYGILIGAYFFSTATTEAEALEEADWVADFIAQYPITYPVAFNCEGFNEPDSRQRRLTAEGRTDLALVFLGRIAQRGYIPMFYASQSDLQTQWETSRIDSAYRVWVAQYPALPYPQTLQSTYPESHQMWQYTQDGTLDGISGAVDRNVAWFGFSQAAQPKDPTPPETATPDVESMMTFQPVNESVTAKIKTNLRDIPSQDDDSTVLYTLQNGEWITRTGISDSGWSRLERGGVVYYAVSNYLTADPNYSAVSPEEEADGINTVFTAVNDRVTAKDVVNLRSIPSVTREDSVVVAQLTKGEWITRTGINTDVGWSRVEYNGQTLYCITSYLETEDTVPEETAAPTE